MLFRNVREREPLLEVDPLVDDLEGREHQVVRVEVAADVGVRKEPLVRRVSQALEAIELRGPQRVDRPQLIGDEDAPVVPVTRASSDTASLSASSGM